MTGLVSQFTLSVLISMQLSPRQLRSVIITLLALLVILGGTYFESIPEQPSTSLEVPIASESPTPTATPAAEALQATSSADRLFPVTKVVDGDTVIVLIDDSKETVRIVGINTPETVDPRKPVECMGKEASDYLKSRVLNQDVRLETDVTQDDRDRYGRLLRFVFLNDGTDIGLEMISKGYAYEALYSKMPHVYRDAYVAAEKIAQFKQRGLWAQDVCPVQ